MRRLIVTNFVSLHRVIESPMTWATPCVRTYCRG
jgi:hypothetical protein